MKHSEIRQKYIAVRHIFNTLLGVASGDKHRVSCLIYYFIYAKEINCNQDPPGCQRWISRKEI